MGISREKAGVTKNGETVTRYILENAHGIRAEFLDLGAVMTNLWLPDRDGRLEDVVLGYDEVSQYEVNEPSFGCPVGRVANRISGGGFDLNGVHYPLEQNDGTNCLHGGFLRFNYKMYEADPFVEDGACGVVFSRVSPDGEQGFPGNFTYEISYRLTDEDQLIFEIHGVSDQDTLVNMTNHSYFNFGPGGHAGAPVYDHELQIEADEYTPTDEIHLPTGEIVPVEGTPFDFRRTKTVGRDLVMEKGPDYFPGYDHNFVVRRTPQQEDEILTVARVHHPVSGRTMTVATNQKGLQIYTAPFLAGETGKGGAQYGSSSAICFETQYFANAINTPEFDDGVLKQGQDYTHITVYTFETE